MYLRKFPKLYTNQLNLSLNLSTYFVLLNMNKSNKSSKNSMKLNMLRPRNNPNCPPKHWLYNKMKNCVYKICKKCRIILAVILQFL